MAIVNASIQHLTDTASNFTTLNPILLVGQFGIESNDLLTTPKYKIGDGVTAWNSLPYTTSSGGASTWGSITGTLSSQTDLQNELDLKANISDLVSLYVTARNNTGSTITKGSVVYVSGALGQNPTIDLAKADAEATSYDIGVAAFDIPNNTNVQNNVITNGLITGLDTSSFTDGDIIYLSPSVSGGLTNITPISPYFSQVVGYVLHSHNTQGKILVKAFEPLAANTTLSNSNKIAPTSNAIKVNLDLKQNVLTAGSNITIIGNTISSTSGLNTYSTKPSSYTLTLTDVNKIIEVNSSTLNYVIVPKDLLFEVGEKLLIKQAGSGSTNVYANTGVTINSLLDKAQITGKNGYVTLINRGLNEWDLYGDLTLSTVGKKLVLWLDALLKKTIATGVSVWGDNSPMGNNTDQSTPANQPVDNTTFLTFDGTDHLIAPTTASLDVKDNLTLFTRFKTSATTNFMGLIDKYIGSTSGYALFLDSSKRATTAYYLQKAGAKTFSGTTVLNNGAIHKVHATIECTRKFRNKRLICNGTEPEVIKIGDTYHMFYGRLQTGVWNIYHRSSTSPYFEGSTETFIVANALYCCVLLDGGTFNLVTTDIANSNFLLYTSTTVDSGYTLVGAILTKGAAWDSFAIADPNLIKIGSTFYLYYSSFTAGTSSTIAYATGTVLTSLTKQGTCLGNGASNEFDFNLSADPEVKLMPDGTTYCMFYTGYNSANVKQQQGYATSTNGITWTKFSGNPIHYFTGESFENGIYGPNEPSVYFENGLCRMWYRCDNTSGANFKVGYAEWTMVNNNTINAGNEKVETKVYVNNVVEATNTVTGLHSIDYILPSTQNLYIGGDNASTLYFTGDIYEAKVGNEIITSF